jgi:uncharacterized membrane protein YfcA
MLLLLVLMSWLAATISGVAGFGGALILLPFLTNIVGLKAAVPILTLAQLIGNASRAWFGREHIRWRLVGYFTATAIPTSVAGSLLFADLPTKPITLGIGVLLLVIVGLRRLGITQFNFGERGLLVGGALTGLLSGLAGSAGPLGAAFFLGLNLPAVAYVASEAITALAMHLTKSLIYQRYALMGLRELGYGLLMGIGIVVGSWTGKRLIERLPRHKFVVLIEILLAVSALQLILTAIR